jgi:hypothetical protein
VANFNWVLTLPEALEKIFLEDFQVFEYVYHLNPEEYAMNSTEKLYEIIKDMTEPTVTELLDFAEFLKGKKQSKKVMNDEMLSALKGGGGKLSCVGR